MVGAERLMPNWKTHLSRKKGLQFSWWHAILEVGCLRERG